MIVYFSYAFIMKTIKLLSSYTYVCVKIDYLSYAFTIQTICCFVIHKHQNIQLLKCRSWCIY